MASLKRRHLLQDPPSTDDDKPTDPLLRFVQLALWEGERFQDGPPIALIQDPEGVTRYLDHVGEATQGPAAARAPPAENAA